MPEDSLRRLDDPDYPSLTMSQAVELLGVQPAFLRSLDSAGLLQPHRSPGGHRRYSRHQLELAARIRELLDGGHPLLSAEAIVHLEDQLADAQSDLADAQAVLRNTHPPGPRRQRTDEGTPREGQSPSPGGNHTHHGKSSDPS